MCDNATHDTPVDCAKSPWHQGPSAQSKETFESKPGFHVLAIVGSTSDTECLRIPSPGVLGDCASAKSNHGFVYDKTF